MLTSTDDIDTLLEKYLHLLDEYTRARELITKLQASVQLDLSRANFSAERGIRYGQDYYDERMQASRRVHIEPDPTSTTASTIPQISIASTASVPAPTSPAPEAEDSTSESDASPSSEENREDITPNNTASSPSQSPIDPLAPAKEDDGDDASPAETKPSFNTKDPIRWFGIIAPTSLRSAQQTSISLITQTVPRVVALDAQLKELEIDIRRARKYHAKEVRSREMGSKGVSGDAEVQI